MLNKKKTTKNWCGCLFCFPDSWACVFFFFCNSDSWTQVRDGNQLEFNYTFYMKPDLTPDFISSSIGGRFSTFLEPQHFKVLKAFSTLAHIAPLTQLQTLEMYSLPHSSLNSLSFLSQLPLLEVLNNTLIVFCLITTSSQRLTFSYYKLDELSPEICRLTNLKKLCLYHSELLCLPQVVWTAVKNCIERDRDRKSKRTQLSPTPRVNRKWETWYTWRSSILTHRIDCIGCLTKPPSVPSKCWEYRRDLCMATIETAYHIPNCLHHPTSIIHTQANTMTPHWCLSCWHRFESIARTTLICLQKSRHHCPQIWRLVCWFYINRSIAVVMHNQGKDWSEEWHQRADLSQ